MSIAQSLNSPDYRLEGFRFYTDIAQPNDFPTHRHSDIEIALILNQASALVNWHQGNGQCQSQPIETDRLCIIPSNQHHSIGWQKPAEYINIFVHPTLLLQTAQDCAIDPCLTIRGQYGICDPLIRSLALTLRTALQAEGLIEHLYIDVLINTLLVYLLKTYAGCKFTAASEKPVHHQRWLKDVLHFIHSSLDQDLRLAKLAEIANMSESGFCHLFKEYMDISPHQYIIQERIIFAKELLLKREMPISEVAFSCGFNSQSHLTLYFRQHTGLTPKAYQMSS